MIEAQIASLLQDQPASFSYLQKNIAFLIGSGLSVSGVKKAGGYPWADAGFCIGRKKTDPQVNDHTLGNLVEN